MVWQSHYSKDVKTGDQKGGEIPEVEIQSTSIYSCCFIVQTLKMFKQVRGFRRLIISAAKTSRFYCSWLLPGLVWGIVCQSGQFQEDLIDFIIRWQNLIWATAFKDENLIQRTQNKIIYFVINLQRWCGGRETPCYDGTRVMKGINSRCHRQAMRFELGFVPHCELAWVWLNIRGPARLVGKQREANAFHHFTETGTSQD